MKFGSLVLSMAVVASIGVSAAKATTVTFDDQYALTVSTKNTGWGYNTLIPSTYAPTVAPGVTMTVTGQNGPKGGATSVNFLKYGNIGDLSTNDVTSMGTSPTGINVFGFNVDDGNVGDIVLTFSSPVAVASLYVNTLASDGKSPVTVTGYDADFTPLDSVTVTTGAHDYFAANTAASAVKVTTFASTPVSVLVIEGYLPQLDDVTVAGGDIPEPASLGLLGLGAVALLRRRK